MSGAVLKTGVAPSSPLKWAEEEIGGAELGDVRLAKRLVKVLAASISAPNESIPRRCGEWFSVKGAYRFFSNEKVEPSAIIDRHRQSVVRRAQGESVVLAVQDTTFLDYTHYPETQGLGPLADMVHHGLVLHPTFVVTPSRVPLGFIFVDTWILDIDTFGTSDETRKDREIEEKESRKWLNGFGESENFQREVGEGTMVVVTGDRESDVYELLFEATRPETKCRLIARAMNNRTLLEEAGHVFDAVAAEEPVAEIVVGIPRRLDRKPRRATLAVRFKKVTLRVPPGRPKSSGLAPIEVMVVSAEEVDPPEGIEAVSWTLLTTLPVDGAEDAIRVVEWYACRWMIEVLFRVLKTGCLVEKRQLETRERLERCLAVDLIVAWRILYLTMVGRETPNLPCSAVFEEYEWKALYVFVHKSRDAVPKEPPTLREVTRLIGRLGGHLGRKSDGHPGPMTLWRGLQRLPDISEMWQIFEMVDLE